jgi:hypothetical protein
VLDSYNISKEIIIKEEDKEAEIIGFVIEDTENSYIADTSSFTADLDSEEINIWPEEENN